MDSVLEEQRKLHEERERIEDALVKENMLKKSTMREAINSDHRTADLLERNAKCAQRLLALYNDHDGLCQEEIQAMSGPDEFREFYRRVKAQHDHFNQNYAPGEEWEDDPLLVEFMRMDRDRQNPTADIHNILVFSDEEGYGKFLDMHALHDQFLNIKHAEKVDYLTYLQTFDRLYEIPKDEKGITYVRYVESLLDYLAGYLERIQPLLDQNKLVEEVKKEFDEKWSAGQFPGWRKDTGSAMAKHSGAMLDLTTFSSLEELMSLGLDRLKSALMALGLKCGGTLNERAQRLFSIRGKPLDQLDPSLYARHKSTEGRDSSKKQMQVAFLEAQVYRYSELLSEQRSATKDNVERRLARTVEELEGEEGEDEAEEAALSDDSDDDQDTVPYNPKNLPLGWDGKPIPYWLYKLHGLNITYECEICGGAQYRGPKAFQRHFSEWRHAFGMRCLGIPNTAHFANVTNIADARALWEKLKSSKAKERWQASTEEEYEDRDGNVFNRKTYDDLRRQGLL